MTGTCDSARRLCQADDEVDRVPRELRVALAYTYGQGNPYTSELSRYLAANAVSMQSFRLRDVFARRVDVVHLQWPEIAAKPSSASARVGNLARLILLYLAARVRGVRLVWTIHNISSHDAVSQKTERFVSWLTAVAVDGVICMNDAVASIALESLPSLRRKPLATIPHGHYRSAYGYPPPDRQAARERLGLNAEDKVFLFFGIIKPYKNVPELIRAFGERRDSDWSLLIAGRVSEVELARTLSRACSADEKIKLHDGFVESAMVPYYFAAADLCVLPFRDILNSGSLLLSLSMDTAVLIPSLPSLAEWERSVGTAWVRTYNGPLGIEDLASAVTTVAQAPDSPDLAEYSWERVGRETHRFYLDLVDHG